MSENLQSQKSDLSSANIPTFEGSMISLRNQSAVQSQRYKSAVSDKNESTIPEETPGEEKKAEANAGPLMECEFCLMEIPESEEEEHIKVCEEFLLPCPSGCDTKDIRRKDMNDHLENICELHEINCTFHDSGCTFKSLRTEMVKHVKESPGIHLNLVGKTISLHKKQMSLLNEIISKQNEKIEELISKVNLLDKFSFSTIIWKIDNFEERFNDAKNGKKPLIYSPAFVTHTHGYRLMISAALYGDGTAKGKFMSVFVCICKGDYDALQKWPFSHSITLTLLDQNENEDERRHIVKAIKPNVCKENLPFLGRPLGDKNVQFGAQKFIDLESLQTLDYLLDDTIFIKFEVDYSNVQIL